MAVETKSATGKSPSQDVAVLPASGRLRAVVEHVRPQVEGGLYAAKTSVGEIVAVTADVFCDGHDLVIAEVRYQHESDRRWSLAPMVALGNDRFGGGFRAEMPGNYKFQVRASVDRWRTWRRELAARVGARQELGVELQVGAELVAQAAARARGADRRALQALASALAGAPRGLESDAPVGPSATTEPGAIRTLSQVVFDDEIASLVSSYRDSAEVVGSPMLDARCERARARFSTWYELFPRSASPDPSRPGTLSDVEARLDYVANLGADVLYLPPIHPIGSTARKGRNGSEEADPFEPGSPWAIGSHDGGHTEIDPSLGTLEDFEHLVQAARARGIEVALDLAFQCSPDHPWVTEHPEWFKHRPDGSIRYAENPPKKYQDIYPLDFESEKWQSLWVALLAVVETWIDRGVTIFRVDNPHTKPFRFWKWLLAAVGSDHPEVVFLSEAFTRPAVMYELAKIGFAQSYTYFTWRNTKWELEEYLTELTRSEVADFFRPSFWPNTPDILTEALQRGGKATFISRLVLAATLGASYGIYGPVFELQEHEAREPGSEEYLDSEKYSVRHFELDDPNSLAALVARVNSVRHAHPALQQDRTLRFHAVENDALIAYSKTVGIGEPSGVPPAPADAILVVVSLDPVYRQSGFVQLNLDALGLVEGELFVVHDLLTDARYRWSSARNFVLLDPGVVPAHLFAIETDDQRTGAGV
jgi:starch synthase (maltosyl-transferring)